MKLQRAIETVIEETTGKTAGLSSSETMSGGCINNAQRVELQDGRLFFVKSNPNTLPGMFEAEANGLEALGALETLRVPNVIGVGTEPIPFIVLEFIESGPRGADFSLNFGRKLALLHQESRTNRAGFDESNYLGATPQPNGWDDDWIGFWREKRIGYQLQLARENGYADHKLNRAGDLLLDRLAELLADPGEPCCLIHGDLWGGNYLSDESGRPVLIDPAVYYGRREAEIAMTTLFGGFDRRFYDGYDDVWSLADGSEQRIELYSLYHLLNHLNLFGRSYYGRCLDIMEKYT